MDVEAPFQEASGAGWRLGFNSLFRKEIGEWFQPRRWLVQSALWLVVLNGFLAMVLFVLPNIVNPQRDLPIENPVAEGLVGFFGLGGLALSIGSIILAQNEIIGEKQSGTAEWVLSKPVARSAFFVSKLLANAIGMLVIMVFLQSAIAYVQVTALNPAGVLLSDFLKGVDILGLHVFFYLSLTLMMGVVSENREMVLGISLGTLLIGMLARNFVGRLALLTPWLLSDLAGPVATGEPLTPEMWLPIISTALWSLVFIAVALWRFDRYEF